MTETADRTWLVSEAPEMLPPPPPGVRYVPVRLMGTVISDDVLRARVNRIFHWPMIVLALLVLPLLGVEFFYLHGGEDRVFTSIWWVCAIASLVIWLAFTVEFAIKVTIAESRLEYVRRNWLDIVIILIPLLRPLRVAYLAKTSKAFTLRGVGIKFVKYLVTILVGLEAADRLMLRLGLRVDGVKAPESMTRLELIEEIKRLRRSNDSWEQWYEAESDHREDRGRSMRPRPTAGDGERDEPSIAEAEPVP